MAELALKTHENRWTIPPDRLFLRMLIERESIHAHDLLFDSLDERQQFARQVFLLAAHDELCTNHASPLAHFARTIMHAPETHHHS